MKEPGLDRREFIRLAAAAGAGLAFTDLHAAPLRGMGIVVHSYGIRWNSKIPSAVYPGFTNAIDLLEHSHSIGAKGIQVGISNWANDFVKKVRERREKLDLYLEGSVAIPWKKEDLPVFEQTLLAAREAGADMLRTVTSVGRRYESYHSASEVKDFQTKAVESLQSIEPLLKKHRMKLAVENHKDWTAPELASLMQKLSSEWIGVTLDFGNSVALLEDPMEVVDKLVPYVFTTHVKDMAVKEYADGFLLSEVPLGEGFIDLKTIYDKCVKHNPKVRFNLEMITRDPLQIPCLTENYWKVFPDGTADQLARSLRSIRKLQKDTLPYIQQLNDESRLAKEEENILSCLTYSNQKLSGYY